MTRSLVSAGLVGVPDVGRLMCRSTVRPSGVFRTIPCSSEPCGSHRMASWSRSPDSWGYTEKRMAVCAFASLCQ